MTHLSHYLRMRSMGAMTGSDERRAALEEVMALGLYLDDANRLLTGLEHAVGRAVSLEDLRTVLEKAAPRHATLEEAKAALFQELVNGARRIDWTGVALVLGSVLIAAAITAYRVQHGAAPIHWLGVWLMPPAVFVLVFARPRR